MYTQLFNEAGGLTLCMQKQRLWRDCAIEISTEILIADPNVRNVDSLSKKIASFIYIFGFAWVNNFMIIPEFMY